MASEHGAIQAYVNCMGCVVIVVVVGLVSMALCFGIKIGQGGFH